jgi:hypothetical protein
MFKSRKITFEILGILVLGVMVAIGLAAYSSRQSQAALQSQETPTVTPTPANPPAGTGNEASQYADTFLQALANRLGVSVDTLKQGIAGAASDTLDQAVKDGKLTQEKADQLKNSITEWFNSGMMGLPFEQMGPGMHGKGGFMGRGGQGEFFGWGRDAQPMLMNEFAKALGMDQQSLMTELQSGKSIADVAQEHNVDVQQLKQTVLAAMKTSLDDAVKNNNLTQAQADQIYQNLSNKIDSILNQKWPGDRTDKHDWNNWEQGD